VGRQVLLGTQSADGRSIGIQALCTVRRVMDDGPVDEQPERRHAATVALVWVTAALVLGLVMWWAVRTLDVRGPWFALVVVWAPMTALGTVSHVTPIRLPARFHRLRPFEVDGRAYELLGVRVAKSLLRRGPASWFNPRLHLPATRDAESLARLDAAMRNAEASHALLFVAVLPVVVHALARGWWAAAAWTLAFDVLLNGYPVILQRYNRGRLEAARQHLGPGPGHADRVEGRPSGT
jgi:hypothetical protein